MKIDTRFTLTPIFSWKYWHQKVLEHFPGENTKVASSKIWSSNLCIEGPTLYHSAIDVNLICLRSLSSCSPLILVKSSKTKKEINWCVNQSQFKDLPNYSYQLRKKNMCNYKHRCCEKYFAKNRSHCYLNQIETSVKSFFIRLANFYEVFHGLSGEWGFDTLCLRIYLT